MQIENDKKFSLELFDQINMRDPIDKVPVFLSEKGVNSAELSLRQIMAEELAEQQKKDKLGKQNTNGREAKFQFNVDFFSKRANMQNSLTKTHNQSEYIANRIKLKYLYETYENLVDKKMLEEIFKQKKLFFL